jgi:hypothetical protein
MTKRRWSSREIEALIRRYESEGPTALAIDLCRSEDSVTSQANRLGFLSLTRRQRQALTRSRNPIIREESRAESSKERKS